MFSEIMTPRVDILGISIQTPFKKLIAHVIESGYSRIPVYNHDLDNIKGIFILRIFFLSWAKPIRSTGSR